MEEELPFHTTPIRDVLSSAIETMQDIQAMRRTVQKIHACCMAPVTLPKKAKCYRITRKTHILQKPFKDKQSRSSSNKSGKTVKFESASQEANVMNSHDEPIPRKKKGKKQNRKTKSDQADADPSEDGRNCGLD